MLSSMARGDSAFDGGVLLKAINTTIQLGIVVIGQWPVGPAIAAERRRFKSRAGEIIG